jgi:hypothetical protein
VIFGNDEGVDGVQGGEVSSIDERQGRLLPHAAAECGRSASGGVDLWVVLGIYQIGIPAT